MKTSWIMLKRGPVTFKINNNISYECFDFLGQRLEDDFYQYYHLKVDKNILRNGDVISITFPSIGCDGFDVSVTNEHAGINALYFSEGSPIGGEIILEFNYERYNHMADHIKVDLETCSINIVLTQELLAAWKSDMDICISEDFINSY